MNATDIDRAIAALTPQQRAAWDIQWRIYRANGGSQRFDVWLRRKVKEGLRVARKRLREHGY